MDFAELGLCYTGFNDMDISIRVLNMVTEHPRQYSPMVHHSGPVLSILSSHLAKYVICEHFSQRLLQFRYRFIVHLAAHGGYWRILDGLQVLMWFHIGMCGFLR